MSKLRNPKYLTIAAMLTAIAVILGFFKISITSFIEIRFASLPIAISGAFMGPVVGGIVGGLADVLGYIVKPTGPFFPGFTLTTILTGVIYGICLKPDEDGNIKLKRIIIGQLIVTLIINTLLNTVWLAVLYGKAFEVMIFSRLFKELIMLPINIIILYAVLKPAKKAIRFAIPKTEQ